MEGETGHDPRAKRGSLGPAILCFRDNAVTSPSSPDRLDQLQQRLRDFAAERDWQPFHSPKNLASALIVEAGELLEHFQWLTEEQSRALAQPGPAQDAVAAEMADVLLYLVQLASALEVDLLDAAARKMVVNAAKYPVAKARGRADRASEL